MSELRVRKPGKVSRGGVSPRLSKTEVRKSVLSSRVTFREILVITIYVMNVQDNWEVGKYLRESCYHRIECSAANSLATLMRK